MLNSKNVEKAEKGLERYYIGVVEDHADPLKLGRLRVRVPELYGSIPVEHLPWCNPSSPFGGAGSGSDKYEGGTGYGFFFIPVPGSKVKIHLWRGHPWFPEWYGTHWFQDEVPDEAQLTPPTNYVIKTPNKHLMDFNDTRPYMRLKDFQGNFIILDTSIDTVKLSANEDIQIRGGNFVDMIGQRQIRISTTGNFDLQADGIINIRAGGNVNIDAGGSVELNSGLAVPVAPVAPTDVTIEDDGSAVEI